MTSYLDGLNEQQLEAVEHSGTPLLILAGAGSGKTKTLTAKATHMIKQGKVKPKEILLVTFTNKAAGEMRERVNSAVGTNLPYVGTFHSISSRILRKSGNEIGIKPGYVIYDAGDQQDLIKTILKDMDIDPKRYKPRAIASAISSTKQELLTPGDYEAITMGMFQEIVAGVYREYQKRLHEYTALDFDDLMTQTVRLLRESPETLTQYQDQFSQIMVDEYQDTNTAQYIITKLLTGDNKRLTVVGDASQSIYKWRGADYRNLMKLRKDYSDLTEIRLEQNYRSSQNILSAATDVITNNKSHPILHLFTDQGEGEKIKLIEGYSAQDEAEKIRDEIERLRYDDYEWKDVAILYRTNAQSRAFEEMFIRSGIPYILVGGTKFYERKEVKDVLAYIRVMLNPADKVSYTRAQKNGKRRLATLMQDRDEYMTEDHSAEQIVEHVLARTKYLDKFDKDMAEELTRIENVRELQAVAGEFSSVPDFLENVALVQSEYSSDEKNKNNREAVTLMTLHAAKGLEFRAVFLVGLEEGLFPHSRALEDKSEMEEERRLMYVGITRAKERLFLSYATHRMIWGKSGLQMKSRFIDEIEDNLLDKPVTKISRVQSPYQDRFASRGAGGWKQKEMKTKKTGIRIDALGDETLESFLSGDLSVDELLSR